MPRSTGRGGIQDGWKTAPIAWETCWNMRKWVNEGWSLRYIFNYALALHASYINNKSAPLPSGEKVRPELERFLRRLGYRLVLNSHDSGELHQEDQRADGHGQPDNLIGVEWLSEDDRTDGRE